MPNTPEFHAEQFITHEECDAIRLLHVGGWSDTRLKMTFGYKSERTIVRHRNNSCAHANKFNKELMLRYKPMLVQFDKTDARFTMTSFECAAIKLLYMSGWTYDELSQVLEIESKDYKRHLKSECPHIQILEVDWLDYDKKNAVYRVNPVLDSIT